MRGKSLGTAFLMVAAAMAAAQDGVSTAGSARAGYLGRLGQFPAAREVVVEDFVNYHRHELPRPKAGHAVAMDLRWGSDKAGPDGEAVLQIGFATALQNENRKLRPLNLALVIDKSGSMAAHDKMERVKQSLLALVEQLRETDTVSLVAFDSEASVVFPSQRLRDKEALRAVVRGLRPGSSTNIHGGLMLGFEQALKGHDKGSTNRVVLLTDGIANMGVVDPEKIAADSLAFNERGIDLSTIGLGADLNKDLLRKLAKSGRGLYHFVADDADIEKVFVQEAQSQVSPVADKPDLVVEVPNGLRLKQVYGFEPKVSAGRIQIPLDTMNSGMTQVVLMRFAASPGRHKVRARLSYRDIESGRHVTLSETADVSGAKGEETVTDPLVLKNATIAELAQALHDMAVDVESNRFRHAKAGLDDAILTTKERYPSLSDADIKRNLDMAVTFRDLLTREIELAPASLEGDGPSQGPNLIANGDFSQGNTGFACDLDYIKPSPNCLWGTYYTVVPAFNAPHQLHTNVRSEPFAAPGGGNVMFMNAGGTHEMTVYRCRVKCQPRTRYQLSFNEISLSGGPEWVHTYEIRVNGDASPAQAGGDGRYARVSYEWHSGTSTSATVSIVRLARTHTGGVIGIANVQMRATGRG